MDANVAVRLADRAGRAGISLPPTLRDALLAYYALLSRWNAKINLTSLTNADEAIDRLLLEPVAAAAFLPHGSRLMDLGSGGGSPAIPLALAAEAAELVMVESRGRKAAFLREAARLCSVRTTVEAERFEDLSSGGRYRGRMDVVSVRAVRMDAAGFNAAGSFLCDEGVLAMFVSAGANLSVPSGFRSQREALVGKAELLLLRR